jgi:hypothetical protein
MNVPWRAVLLASLIATATALAGSGSLPIYFEDNHAGTFYWLAQHVDLEQPCTLIHFDAHSDASGIFDSDKIRAAIRNIASIQDRQTLLDRWRKEGAVQCFNWIEPLMPAPIAKVIWVPRDKLTGADRQQRAQEAARQIDGHLEAAPRKAGPLAQRYTVADFDTLPKQICADEQLIVTIDLDYFAEIPADEQSTAFDRLWNLVITQKSLRAVTFAISRPYLRDDAEADRLLSIALSAALLLPTARIEFEPFLCVSNDRSARAKEFVLAGKTPPSYGIANSSEALRGKILAQSDRINVPHELERWGSVLRVWKNETAQLRLEVKNVQQSTDGIWRVPSAESYDVELVAEPWMTKPERVEWFALVPRFIRCNVTELSPDRVGFVRDAVPRPAWNEIRLPFNEPTLPGDKIDNLFDRQFHCGSIRLRARALVDGKVRETPALEIRRSVGTGFRAAITEQFGLPYVFGSGGLADEANTGPETGVGADCANFIVYALRRQGFRIPWSDPKQLRRHVDLVQASIAPGFAHFTADELERGLIVHLGSHVAAVMEDRAPFGVLNENDLVAHQLNGVPEMLTLEELLHDRKKRSFDLYRAPAAPAAERLLFGGDIMLGRTCGDKIDNGVDPFAGIGHLLARSSFTAANLECVISDSGEAQSRYSFRASGRSAALLQAANFRAVGLANNHAFDFGPEALRNCATKLLRHEIRPVGFGVTADDAYSAAIFPLSSGKTLALIAITDLPTDIRHGVQIATSGDRRRLRKAIVGARAKADLVACLVHWGIESRKATTDRQRKLARWLVDQGVDAVIGSHPHCVQPLDFYHACPVA